MKAGDGGNVPRVAGHGTHQDAGIVVNEPARNKKREAEGKPLLEEDVRKAAVVEAPKDGTPAAEEDEANKRWKFLQEALEMDKDDDEDEKNDDDGDERYVPWAVR